MKPLWLHITLTDDVVVPTVGLDVTSRSRKAENFFREWLSVGNSDSILKMKSLTVQFLKDLTSPHWSAASGLVVTKKYFFSIADDELHLLVHQRKGATELAPGKLVRLFDGKLPTAYKARKKLKPDLESLAFWPKARVFNFDQLLAVPSGSKRNRVIGARIRLSASGAVISSKLISFAGFYAKLEKRFRELNIEGAVIRKTSIRFYQRGNGERAENAVITYDRKIFEAEVLKGEITGAGILKVQKIRLGKKDGHAYSFTDACIDSATHDVFVAAVESSPDTYQDGQFLAAKLGWIDIQTGKIKMKTLAVHQKPEGLAKISAQKYWIVTDADDRKVAAGLFQVHIR